MKGVFSPSIYLANVSIYMVRFRVYKPFPGCMENLYGEKPFKIIDQIIQLWLMYTF